MDCCTEKKAPKQDFTDSVVFELLEGCKKEGKTAEWIADNHSFIIEWCRENGGWVKWLKKVNIKYKPKWNEEKILNVLSANKNRDRKWFLNNEEYTTIIGWAARNGGWKKLAEKAGLLNYNKRRTPENILEFLTENKNKTPMWVITNHNAIYKWCTRNGGFPSWAKKSGMII